MTVRKSNPNRLAIMELHFDAHPGTGPYLLLVHGFLSSRAQFAPNLAGLSRVTRPVVIELWGHGRSPVPNDPALFHPDAYVDAFERLRERLDADRWIICGQSLGAALTLRYALAHPNRVAAHIFTNTTSAFADAAWVENVRRNVSARGDAIAKGGRAGLEQMPIHPKHATRLPEESRAALLRDTTLLDPIGVAKTIEFTVPESPVRDRVHTNAVPSLLVCGTREKRFKDYRAFAEKTMPMLDVVCVDAGHAVNIEAASAFTESTTRFIEQQDEAR